MSFTSISHSTTSLFEATHPSSVVNAPSKEESFWGEEGLTFESFLDTVNPLQQLPVVSSIYRAVVDDPISTGSRLAGGALFGGPLGFASALVNTVVEDISGKDIGANVLSVLDGQTAATASALASSSAHLTQNNVDVEAANRSAYLAYSKATKLL